MKCIDLQPLDTAVIAAFNCFGQILDAVNYILVNLFN